MQRRREQRTPLASLVQDLILHAGDDPEREGLAETPNRFIKAWEFWTSGYNQDPNEVLKTFEDGAQEADEIIFQGAIPLWSLCEHHLAPFFGVAHIGYLPNGKVLGLSKFSRLVDVFARRLQTQERLTNQIATALWDGLKPRGVAVVLRCRHSCIESRGVQKAGSMTYSAALRGIFKADRATRDEFYQFVERADAQANY